MQVTGAVELVTMKPNKGGYFSAKVDGVWYSVGKYPPSFQQGDVLTFESTGGQYKSMNNVRPADGQGQTQTQAQGGGSRGGVKYDNIGAQIGSCINNAVAMHIAGIIKFSDIPNVSYSLVQIGDDVKDRLKEELNPKSVGGTAVMYNPPFAEPRYNPQANSDHQKNIRYEGEQKQAHNEEQMSDEFDPNMPF